ncbi:MAG TPA: DNA polymerase ligase N-terminal domain-containing protein, partial [Terracidiphilus sp.]
MASTRPRKTAARREARTSTTRVKSDARTQPAQAAAKRSAAKPAAKSAARSSSAPAKAAAKKTRTSSADSVDQQLARYRSMRDFDITAEPNGSGGKANKTAAPRTSLHRTSTSRGLPFVIQKHAASHLHYDFRLGWNGVLKSWAVAKGPSFYP